MNADKKQVWFCGGGTQSCAIGALICDGVLPKPDVAVIADTGKEKKATWKYLEQTLQPNLSAVGVQVERVKTEEWGYGGTELWSKTGELLIPAYTTENPASVGKLTGFCNRWWKLDAARVYLSKVHGLTRSKYRSWIGYSFDEQKRWARMMGGEEYEKGLIWFPLVEMRMRRQQSIDAVLRRGWPDPPPSACWCCPNLNDDEWREQLQNAPDEFEAAVALDTEIRKRDPNAWLHKSCKPLGEVDFTKPAETPDLFSRPCDSGGCFT